MSDEQVSDIHEVSGKTPDFRTELAEKLQELAPEAIADGKVDVVKLKELLADDAGDDTERFGLFWPGKKRAMRAAQEPTTATLRPAPALSKDWDSTQNIFIEGDNLEVLKVLQKQYHGKIKMIYIDPPYNTGKDFVYPDNYQEGLQNYLEFTKQVDEGGKKISTNSDTDGRYHSHWLNMMYPRLKLARNLLTDDGVIFISIDDNESDNLRHLCDEIFGEGNFVAQFAWRKTFNQSNIGNIAKVKEYIICYSRSIDRLKLNKMPLTESARKEYKYKDEKGYFARTRLMHTTRGRHKYSITTPTGREVSGTWMVPKEKLSEMITNNEVWWGQSGDGYPNGKVYLADSSGQITNDFLGKEFGSNQQASLDMDKLMEGRFFDFPKPVSLIKHFSTIGGSNDSIILDFFSGSGTTAHAVMQLNAEDGGTRKHIQVQLPEPTDEESEAYKSGYQKISDIARERINRAGEKIKTDYAEKLAERDTPLDTGYRTYKLADTNFTKWASNFVADVDVIQQRLDLMRESSSDNASESDLLVEILLKLGLELTTPTESIEIAGLSYFKVGDGILVRFDEHTKPSLDQLRAAADTLPTKFVILEDAFQGDDQLKTNLHQICKTNNIELWTV